VVDNYSGDAIYLPGLWQYNASSSFVIPVAASTWGANDSRWRTDLRVLPVDPVTAVEVTFMPGDGSSPVTGSFELGNATLLVLDDVVGRLGASGSGALVVSGMTGVEPARIMGTSRTYNTTADGTYGQFIPAGSGLFQLGTILGIEG
jgi:hypothetical protein